MSLTECKQSCFPLVFLCTIFLLTSCQLYIHEPNSTIFEKLNRSTREYFLNLEVKKEMYKKYINLVCEGPVVMKWKSVGFKHRKGRTLMSYRNQNYTATLRLFLSELSGGHDSGYYTCEAVEEQIRPDNPAVSIYLFIMFDFRYGEFVLSEGRYIQVEETPILTKSSNDADCVKLLIPCHLSNPKSNATIVGQTPNNRIVYLNNVTYDAKVGFRVWMCPGDEAIAKFICKDQRKDWEIRNIREFIWKPFPAESLNKSVEVYTSLGVGFKLSCMGDRDVSFRGNGDQKLRYVVTANFPRNTSLPFTATLEFSDAEKQYRFLDCGDSHRTIRFEILNSHDGPSPERTWDFNRLEETYACFSNVNDKSLILANVECINESDCQQQMENQEEAYNDPHWTSKGENGRTKLSSATYSSGVFVCRNSFGLHMNKYFTGVDGLFYFVDNDAIPESAIVSISLTSNPFYLGIHSKMQILVKHSTYFVADWALFFVKNRQGQVTELSREFLSENNRTVPSDITFRSHEWELIPETWMSEIIYSVPLLNETTWRNFSAVVDVQDEMKPEITNTELDFVFYIGEIGPHEINCNVTGAPPPEITWTRLQSELVSKNVLYLIQKEKLIFPAVVPQITGKYQCTAVSDAHNISDSKIFNVMTEEIPFEWNIYSGMPVAGVVVTGLFVFLYVCLKTRDRNFSNAARNFTDHDVQDFFEGNGYHFLPLDPDETDYAENAIRMPYDDVFEIDENDIVYDTQAMIGKGSFGIVYKGFRKPSNKVVAVKSVQSKPSIQDFKRALLELKILVYVGYHPYIVEFIGAITKKIGKMDLKIILEYCENGDMNSYIRKVVHSPDYVERKTSVQNAITTQFLEWLIGITLGMEHLAKRKIIHGDLATRNILLDAKLVPKITDFGLALRSADYTSYIKKGTSERLPWRWMALESLTSLTFSTASDIWALGVTAWEMFTFGEVPYPNCSWDLNFTQSLKEGFRLPKPENCPDEIYVEILACWEEDVNSRINASTLQGRFKEILEKST